MQVYRDISHLPEFRNAVITIGTFDGVHLGHQQIIRLMKAEAGSTGGETVIISFHPHPRNVVSGDTHAIALLNTMEEKIGRLSEQGIDHFVIVPFTEVFSKLSAEEYVRHFLVEKFHPSILITGYDHRFGAGRTGGYALLEKMGAEYGFTVKEIPEHVLNTVTISSTRIRKALLAGRLEEANNFLGYPYTLSGTVVMGDRRGRTIGFPTANISIDDTEKLIPANGVYAVRVALRGRENSYLGMMNIGVRPTVDGTRRTIEVHILRFGEEIYGRQMDITLLHFIRQEKKFASLDELRQQLEKDREIVEIELSDL